MSSNHLSILYSTGKVEAVPMAELILLEELAHDALRKRRQQIFFTVCFLFVCRSAEVDL